MVIFHLKFLTLIESIFSPLQENTGTEHSEQYIDSALWTEEMRLAASKTLSVITYNLVTDFAIMLSTSCTHEIFASSIAFFVEQGL
jgi:hypothetical protein